MRGAFAIALIVVLAIPLGGVAAQARTLAEADAHFQAKRWAEAERAYQAILKNDSTVALAWYRLGRVYLEGLNDGARAEVHFSGALRHKFAPPFFAQLGQARAYTVQRKTAEALRILETLASTGFFQPTAITGDSILMTLSQHEGYRKAVAQMQRNTEPCEHAPEARQLDFWVGTWDVTAPNGQPLGTNVIQKMLRGCALMENWTGGLGREGKSLNFYHPQQKTWRQVWMSDTGSALDYTAGRFDGRSMVFTGHSMSPKGDTIVQKLIFERVHADTVKQVFEQSNDRGKSWTTTWTGIYTRRK